MPESNLYSEMDALFSEFNKGAAEQPSVQKKVQNKSAGNSFSIQKPESLEATALDKIHAIEHELNQIIVERDDAIHCLMLAVISGTHMLMLGPAGAGKSKLASEFCSRIDSGVYFQWLLNKTSDPSEIVGPVSIKSMENDHYMRIPDGKLPEAHIAFIDECYKANSPTLNMLLPIMNEKIFYNDGKPVKIPLITMIGASNEPPEDDSLIPFHDRFLFRINVKYVKDTASRKKMFSNYIAERANINIVSQKTMISIQELKALEKKAKNISVSKDIINSFIRLLSALKKNAVTISDRRQNECIKVLQASAVLRGANAVDYDDFHSLLYILWEKEEDMDIIEKEISKFVNPFDSELNACIKSYHEIKRDFEAETDPDAKIQKALEAKTNIEKILTKVNKIEINVAKNGRSTDQFEKFKAEAAEYANTMLTLITSQLGDNNG